MAFDSFKRERRIRQALRALAHQRVAVVLQPGNVWVIENSPTDTAYFEESICSCLMRGWVAVLHEAIPSGSLTADGNLPKGPLYESRSTVYRLTEAGWMVINRSQTWVISTFTVAFATLVATVVMLWRG